MKLTSLQIAGYITVLMTKCAQPNQFINGWIDKLIENHRTVFIAIALHRLIAAIYPKANAKWLH